MEHIFPSFHTVHSQREIATFIKKNLYYSAFKYPSILMAYCCSLLNSLLLVSVPFLTFNFLFSTGLSFLLGPLGFWHLALPVGVCSLQL